MQLVFDGMLTCGIVLVGLWLWSLRGSITRDKTEAEIARRESREKAVREARLARKGEPLRCVSCEKTFRGPLTDRGCPHCHLASFVLPEAEYQEKREKFGHGD